MLVCVGAPIVEELFFRGFFFTALRSWRGMWPAAIITGVVFGAIHAGSADAAFLLPLGFFGFALCLLYVKTGSLYPCIGAHALNNSLAFGASQDWDWQILPPLAGSLCSSRDPRPRALRSPWAHRPLPAQRPRTPTLHACGRHRRSGYDPHPMKLRLVVGLGVAAALAGAPQAARAGAAGPHRAARSRRLPPAPKASLRLTTQRVTARRRAGR